MVKKRRMNVATSLNGKYVRYACVMLSSFFVNHTEDMDIHVYILHSGLSEEDKRKLEEQVRAYDGTLHLFLIDQEAFAEFMTTDAWTAEAYYRLKLTDILPEEVDRILYLDVDIIVNGNLEELYFSDFEENMICACKDVCEAPFKDNRDIIFEDQIKQGFTYFCSGMLLLNIFEMRKKYCFKDYMDLARRLDFKMVAPDQDILNYMHWKEVKHLDPDKYNLFTWAAYMSNIHYAEVKKDTAIVHFSGPKPWSGNHMRCDIEELWWEYARLTPFHQELMEEFILESVRNAGTYAQLTSLYEEKESLSKLLMESVKLCEKYKNIAQRMATLKLRSKGYDNNKIAFIICANNSLYYDECAWYLNRLHVPDGYETDVICITEAESMAQGYQAAMKDSDAKYKVYLHQDVFIYNRFFIDEMLGIFQSDSQIGLMGVIGGINLPQNADTWNAWNIGRAYVCDYEGAFFVNAYQEEGRRWIEVEAADGMLLATQYDLDWREDLIPGFDFYDVSQSLEFRRCGYKVVIPFQAEPWCMHDCGHSKLVHYDEARKNILKEYTDFFSGIYEPEYDSGNFRLEEEYFQILKECLEQGYYEKALGICAELHIGKIKDNDLQYAINMLDIYLEEKKREAGVGSFFPDYCRWDEIKSKYDEIKFALRHAERGTNGEVVEALKDKIDKREISRQAILVICKYSVFNQKLALARLLGDDSLL